jgi:hypothetical protein
MARKIWEEGMASLRLTGGVIVALISIASAAHAQLMIIGNDQKPKIDNGNNVMQPPGHDTLSIVDISKPAAPRIVASSHGQHDRRTADQPGDHAER